MQYLPFGEDFIEQHVDWQTRYTFSGKEKDRMTDFSYFGARYYDSEVSVWLSVDPLSSKYPNELPYCYAGLNPIKFLGPNGIWKSQVDDKFVIQRGELLAIIIIKNMEKLLDIKVL